MMLAQARASHYYAQIHYLHVITHYPPLLKALLSLGVGATNLFSLFTLINLFLFFYVAISVYNNISIAVHVTCIRYSNLCITI